MDDSEVVFEGKFTQKSGKEVLSRVVVKNGTEVVVESALIDAMGERGWYPEFINEYPSVNVLLACVAALANGRPVGAVCS